MSRHPVCSRGHSIGITAVCFYDHSVEMARKITALKAQKKNPNRVNVYLDGEFAFSVARIVAAWLEVGQELTDEKIEKILEQDAFETAYQKGLKLIGYRMRTANEIKERLVRKGISTQVVSGVQDRLKRSGIVDDDRFARNWVENRTEFRPRSHRLLSWELRQKGVDEDIIQRVLESALPDEDLAYQAGLKQLKRYHHLEKEDFRQKLSGFLARRGFTFEVIKPVVERLWNELNKDVGSDH